MEFTENTLRRFMKEIGVSRCSKSAVYEFGEVLERYAGFLCEEACYLAEKNKRRTVRRCDIMAAISS